MKKYWMIACAFLPVMSTWAQDNTPPVKAKTASETSMPQQGKPLLPGGADPWCIYRNGYYYYTNTTGKNITLWKTRSMADLAKAEKKIVFDPPPGTAYSKQLWAPEIHYLRDKWYIYFAADSGDNKDHRLFVLEHGDDSAAVKAVKEDDPLQGTWTLKARLDTPGDKWSIDGTVYDYRDSLYLLWSGWWGDVNGEQDLYIAPMSDPWTVSGDRVRLSRPTLDWETHGDLDNKDDVPHVNVNEGPQILEHQGRVFIIYSASGCWTEYYALGMLSLKPGGSLLDSTAWIKNPLPVFTANPAAGVYAPGHNSFFQSPDGRQDWILYHANDQPGQGCGSCRSPRAQRFTWNKDGTPQFGKPIRL